MPPHLTTENLRARMVRFGELSMGLMREVAIIRPGRDPLLYRERQDYLAALHEAVAGLESARVALAGACRRIEEDGKPASGT